jgi:hypothetical protein
MLYHDFLYPCHVEHLLGEGFHESEIEMMVEKFRVCSLSAETALDQGFKCRSDDGGDSISSGLLFPFSNSYAQLRVDNPPIRQGKPAKYLTPIGKTSEAFLPKGVTAITEGWKDAFAGWQKGGVVTGAIAGVSHYRKALPKGCGYTIVFDADGWQNLQVFANLIHAGEWCAGRVALLPPVEGDPKAGLCEFFKTGHTAQEYQALIAGASKPTELLMHWPEIWREWPTGKIRDAARLATRLAGIYMREDDCNFFINQLCDRHKNHGLNCRYLQGVAQKYRDRVSPKQHRSKFARDYQVIKNRYGQRLQLNLTTYQPELDRQALKLEKVRIQFEVKDNLPIRCGRDDLYEIVMDLAEENSYNPLVDYLQSVYEEHGNDASILEGMANRYLGNTTPIAQTQLIKTLIRAVARAYDPGCKADDCTVLQGAQGCGKSQFLKTLASPSWFCDDFFNPDDKDHMLKLHEAWIVEWAELTGLSRREITRVKQFMAVTTDRIRRPYARESQRLPRPSILVGSTNESDILTDTTGNRRWWIIPVYQKIPITLLEQERDSIWAASVSLYKSGVKWYLTDEEEAAAEFIRKDFETQDPWQEDIAKYVEGRDQISISDLCQQALGLETSKRDPATQRRVAGILKKLGWQQGGVKRGLNGLRMRNWEKINWGCSQTGDPCDPVIHKPSNPVSETLLCGSHHGSHKPQNWGVCDPKQGSDTHTPQNDTPTLKVCDPPEIQSQQAIQAFGSHDTPKTPIFPTPQFEKKSSPFEGLKGGVKTVQFAVGDIIIPNASAAVIQSGSGISYKETPTKYRKKFSDIPLEAFNSELFKELTGTFKVTAINGDVVNCCHTLTRRLIKFHIEDLNLLTRSESHANG